MLPVQDAIPSRTTPWLTLGLIVLMGGTLASELLLSEHAVRGLILSYGLVPAHLAWPTLITSAFLHYGVVDAAVNLLALWIFGDNVEDRLGRPRFAALFLVGVVVSGLVEARLQDGALTAIIGAAGGVGAIIGAHVLLLRPARVLMLMPIWRGIDLIEVPSGLVVMAWLVLTGATGAAQTQGGALAFAPAVPVVGLLTGAALARLLARPERLACAWWNVPSAQGPDLRRTSRETSASSSSSASN